MTRLLYRDNPWLQPVKKFLDEVWASQGQTNPRSCSGMDSMVIVGLTQMPVLYDAWEDDFYSVCPEKDSFYNGY